MTTEEFAATIALLIEDETLVKRASPRDLAVLEGLLGALLALVTDELELRAAAPADAPQLRLIST